MYRVLIVDDEPMIRKGLRETVEWDSLGLEISGEAGDGISALEIIDSNPPHILITDIKMPEMDGIGLIRAIKELGLDMKIMILSGYSDFEYMKDAIKLGVDSYLLKPIDNDELTMNLSDAVRSIERTKLLNTRQLQGFELLRLNLLNRLITNNIRMKEFEDKASFLGLSLEAKQYLAAVCCVDFSGGEFRDNEQLALFAVQNICVELTRDSDVVFIDAKGRIVILFLDDTASLLYKAAEAVLNKLTSYVPEHLGVSALIGAGTHISTLEDVWASYDSAVRSLEYSAFIVNNGVIWHKDIVLDSDTTASVNVDYDLIKELLTNGEKEEFCACMDGIFRELQGRVVTVDYIRNIVIRLIIEITGIFRSTETQADYSVAASYDYTLLLKLRSVKEFKDYFYFLCEKLFDKSTSLQRQSRGVVDLVVARIEEYYYENLTLSQMAADYHINTSYLGQVFKKEKGVSFTSYINGFRIKKAKELLTDPGLKVYEIAEKVGFTDYHYFLKIYKKFTGANPTDLRC